MVPEENPAKPLHHLPLQLLDPQKSLLVAAGRQLQLKEPAHLLLQQSLLQLAVLEHLPLPKAVQLTRQP